MGWHTGTRSNWSEQWAAALLTPSVGGCFPLTSE